MQEQRSKNILIYIILFLIIGTLNNKHLNKIDFKKIDKIIVIGLDDENNFELINDLNFLKVGNLFFLDKAKIKEIINSNSLVENYSVFKKYPSTLIVKIDKTKFLAQLEKEGNNFLLGSNGKLIKTIKLKEDIPLIFGKFKNKEFFNLKKAIDETNFNYYQIKNLFSFQSGRWDIETKNGLLIKLPQDEIKTSLILLIDVLKKDNKNEIKKIDLRQYNQIIING